MQGEVGRVQDQLDTLTTNGRIVVERTDNQPERELVQSTVANLTDQLAALMTLVEDKKHAANDAVDAWAKFLALHAAVKTWAAEREAFLAEPLTFVSLSAARLKHQDYAAAIKSVRNVE